MKTDYMQMREGAYHLYLPSSANITFYVRYKFFLLFDIPFYLKMEHTVFPRIS
jgi:hypothetical protein